MSRILLAGATGHLGRAMLPELKERGHTIVALTRQPTAYDAVDERPDEVRQGPARRGRDPRAQDYEGVGHNFMNHASENSYNAEVPEPPGPMRSPGSIGTSEARQSAHPATCNRQRGACHRRFPSASR